MCIGAGALLQTQTATVVWGINVASATQTWNAEPNLNSGYAGRAFLAARHRPARQHRRGGTGRLCQWESGGRGQTRVEEQIMSGAGCVGHAYGDAHRTAAGDSVLPVVRQTVGRDVDGVVANVPKHLIAEVSAADRIWQKDQ